MGISAERVGRDGRRDDRRNRQEWCQRPCKGERIPVQPPVERAAGDADLRASASMGQSILLRSAERL